MRKLLSAAKEPPINNQPTGEIHTIFGGHGGGGDSNNAQKAYARSISCHEEEVLLLGRPLKEQRMEKYNIAFTEEDARGIHFPHDNALVITSTITNQKVFRIPVDTGSLVDVLFIQTFNKMGVGRSLLRPIKTPLVGFSGG